MTIKDYQKVLDLQKEALAASERFEKAAAPWKEEARKIALENHPENATDEVFLGCDRIQYICEGTGIYSGDNWAEYFNLSKLLERMAQK